MVRIILYFISFFILIPSTLNAGFFGPSSYDECIFENMKGVTSDQAAKAIQRACREKFPLVVEEKIVRNKTDFPGFPFNENTYANRLLNWWILNYEQAKMENFTPKEFILIQYKRKKEKNNYLDYDTWIKESDIDYFFKKVNEFEDFMNEK